MTPTELRKQLVKSLSTAQVESVDNNGEAVIEHEADRLLQLITADRKRVALEARIEPFDFVESCEPDCDDVRHAYHQGQWDMATRIKARQEEV